MCWFHQIFDKGVEILLWFFLLCFESSQCNLNLFGVSRRNAWMFVVWSWVSERYVAQSFLLRCWTWTYQRCLIPDCVVRFLLFNRRCFQRGLWTFLWQRWWLAWLVRLCIIRRCLLRFHPRLFCKLLSQFKLLSGSLFAQFGFLPCLPCSLFCFFSYALVLALLCLEVFSCDIRSNASLHQ